MYILDHNITLDLLRSIHSCTDIFFAYNVHCKLKNDLY